MLFGAVQAVGHQHDARGVQSPAFHGAQQDLGADVVSGDQRPRAEHVGGEAAQHLGKPVDRVGVARPILGVAVQRQVGQHHAEALGQPPRHRLPLHVREHRGVQQRQRGTGAELTVGHPCAIRMVVKTQSHSRARLRWRSTTAS